MNQSDIILIFSNCIVVDGANRSSIYDLQRNKYYLIPKDLSKILNEIKNGDISIDILKKKYNKSIKIIEEYLFFLFENEIITILPINIKKKFPDINLNWDYPAIITSCILEFHINIHVNIKKTIFELNNLNCKHIDLHFYFNVKYNELLKILKILDEVNLKSVSIYFFVNPININSSDFSKIINKYCFIISVFIFKCEVNSNEQVNNSFIRRIAIAYEDLDIVNPNNFIVNMELFCESQNYNTYYNRKLIITDKININTEFQVSFSSEIKEHLQNKFMNVNKNMIEICKDCEFRYMCIDKRTPHYNKIRGWHFETECNYNPYKAEWIFSNKT
jgi:SPASM domain peptide maturase of grasp-with-spasm system